MLSFCTTHTAHGAERKPENTKLSSALQRPAISLEHGQLPARVSCPQLLSYSFKAEMVPVYPSLSLS